MQKLCYIHKEKNTKSLKTSKLRVTPIRLKILDVFEHSKKPLRVKDIIKIVKSDIATVYRNLEILIKIGLVKQVFLDQKEAYFESASKKHHHHAVCENCGKVVEIEDLIHNKLDTEAKKQSGFFKIRRHNLEFFGMCKDCV